MEGPPSICRPPTVRHHVSDILCISSTSAKVTCPCLQTLVVTSGWSRLMHESGWNLDWRKARGSNPDSISCAYIGLVVSAQTSVYLPRRRHGVDLAKVSNDNDRITEEGQKGEWFSPPWRHNRNPQNIDQNFAPCRQNPSCTASPSHVSQVGQLGRIS